VGPPNKPQQPAIAPKRAIAADGQRRWLGAYLPLPSMDSRRRLQMHFPITPRSRQAGEAVRSAFACVPWAWWLFGGVAFAGLFCWAMFLGWTTIVTSRWWAPPGHDECIWLLLAAGVVLCANAACVVWALLILPRPLAGSPPRRGAMPGSGAAVP
jgi:hypothetical protein